MRQIKYDMTLGRVLANFFLDQTKSERSAMFDGNGPAATLSSRIRLSFSLGLIAKKEQHDLDLIRRIRNEFAHNENDMTFSDPTVSARCDSLALFEDLIDTAKHIDFSHYTSRDKFQTVGVSLYLTMSAREQQARLMRRSTPPVIPIISKS